MFVAANKGSYIAQAGRANHLADAFKYVSAFSPNPGEIQQQGLKADTAKYISKVENEAKKDYYKTTGQALDEGLDKYNAAAKKAQGQQRMAGILGFTGALAYGTSKYFQDKNNQPPPPEKRESADRSGEIEQLQKNLETMQGYLTKLTAGYDAGSNIKSTEDLYEAPGTKSDTPSTDSKPTAAKPTAAKPFKFEGFDDLDNQAFQALR